MTHRWFADTIARRFALTIVCAVVVTMGLTGVFIEFSGQLSKPPLYESGLLERADEIVRMVEAVPVADRPVMVAAASTPAIHIDWYVGDSTVGGILGVAADLRAKRSGRHADLPGFQSGGKQRRIVYFMGNSTDAAVPKLAYDKQDYPDTRFFAAQLRDDSWVVFTIPTRIWGLERPARLAIGLGFLATAIVIVSAIATNQLARPIKAFTAAAHRFGTDPRMAPVPETGPRELRLAIAAFNAMQSQIQRFVEDRTSMLAAISHDLRTPLTRMRLRAEFIDDDDQRRRLSRDVDEMQVMIDSSLSFFRDDSQDEETTMFDFPELLRTIADGYSDMGVQVPYHGPARAAFHGRPFALTRAFTNLIDNAIKYAACPVLSLSADQRAVSVVVSDEGPGIPADVAEQVFAPFFRMERSRHRSTGGVGLGMTSARAVIRSHGGDITLYNRPGGGLDVRISLPLAVPA
jgi:signal transduction histidine kinase